MCRSMPTAAMLRKMATATSPARIVRPVAIALNAATVAPVRSVRPVVNVLTTVNVATNPAPKPMATVKLPQKARTRHVKAAKVAVVAVVAVAAATTVAHARMTPTATPHQKTSKPSWALWTPMARQQPQQHLWMAMQRRLKTKAAKAVRSAPATAMAASVAHARTGVSAASANRLLPNRQNWRL